MITLSPGIRLGTWSYLKWKNVRPLDKNGHYLDKDNLGARGAAAKLSAFYEKTHEWYGTFMTSDRFPIVSGWK